MRRVNWFLAFTVSALGCGSSGTTPRDSAIDVPTADATAPSDATEETNGTEDATAEPDAAADAGDPGEVSVSPPILPVVPVVETCVPGATWHALPNLVSNAAYSPALDVLLLVPTYDRALYLFNPDTCENRRIPLARRALSVAVSPSGETAAVGHDGYVSVVDLRPGLVRHVVPLPLSADQLAWDVKNHVNVVTRYHQTTEPIWRINTLVGAAGSPWTRLKLVAFVRPTPDARKLLVIEGGRTPASRYSVMDMETGSWGETIEGSAAVPVCGNLFPTDDSELLITACGQVLPVANNARAAGPAVGSLPDIVRISDVATLRSRDRLVLIHNLNWDSPRGPFNDTAIRVHNTTNFAHVKTIPLPEFDGHLREARRVFIRGDGSRYYVLTHITIGGEGGPPLDGIVALDAEIPAGTAPPAIGVEPKEANDRPLTPEQVPATRVPLSFEVYGAGYSRPLNRLVLVSRYPQPAAFIVDPDTGAAEPLATPGKPSGVAVRASGDVAAITHDRGVSFIDLRTRQIIREFGPYRTRASFGRPPYVLVDAPSDALSWLDLGTGAMTPATSFGGYFFVAAPVKEGFYTSLGWLSRHDHAGQPTSQYRLQLYARQFSDCNTGLTISEAGGELLLGCGAMFRLPSTSSVTGEPVYAGGLEGVTDLSHSAYSPQMRRFYSLPASMELVNRRDYLQQWLAIHDDRYLNLERLVNISEQASLFSNGVSGRFLFESQQPGRVYVVGTPASFETPGAIVALDLR